MTSDNNRENPRILIIEDEALVARDIQSRLRQLEYEVVGLAHTPQQALSIAEQTRPDLLLCDIHLKDEVDGIDVATVITRDRLVPVIFLTAYSDSDTITRAKSIPPYGYLLKPVETADLHIAIEMALQKFSVEQELRSTRRLLATALQCIGDALVFIDREGRINSMSEEALDLFELTAGEAEGLDCLELLRERAGLALSANLAWEDLLRAEAMTRLPPFQIERNDMLLLLDGVVGPIKGEHATGTVLILRRLAELQDPIESLPLPADLPGDFNDLHDYPKDHERAFVVLLISADDANTLLESLTRHDRDELIEEIGDQLNLAMRSTDLASYYGGPVFSASLPYTTLEEASSIAGAILQRLSQHRFLDGQLELTVSIGISHYRPGESGIEKGSPLELFRRANSALNLAQMSGGNRVAIWRPSTDIGLIGNLDRQSGLLSEDAGQDYRNLALLWNTMSNAASLHDRSALSEVVVNRIKRSFHLDQVALFRFRGSEPELVAADPACGPQQALALLDDHRATLIRAHTKRELQQEDARYWIPFEFANEDGGIVYLRQPAADEPLRQQDLLLLQSLINYVSGRKVGEVPPSLPVRDEPAPASELLFQSDVMSEVMELIRLVAPTDETVLITGESGTGKEVIAREIHRLSSRASAPFVIVDCGAVVSTLIERELFGHVKGAFTGATQSAIGKLKEADGGTLLLDEIGELPLDLQVKLLRVVQDKQFTAVGSTRVETADTRIIAATNVNLEAEISKGRFREDLYYRLNVFNVHSPPLREREGDVTFLARHFLNRCSAQYGRQIDGFTPAAEDVLLRYPWPGNIRELRNKLIRAVILCQSNRIDVAELGLRRESDRAGSSQARRSEPAATGSADHGESIGELEHALREAMAALVRQCLDCQQLVPLSQWLEQDLILAALELYGQVNLQAADALGIPESTLRRKLSRYRAIRTRRPTELQTEWQAVTAKLPNWIKRSREEGFDPMRHIQNLLLREIDEQAASQAEAATLVGVSPPTYRRQISQLADW